MEDLVLTIPTQDGAFIETLAQRMGWTMRRRTQRLRRAATTPNRREAAMLFVQNLSVRGGQPVPADERGIDALIDEKYNKWCEVQLTVSALSFVNTIYLARKYKYPLDEVYSKLRLVADFVDVADLSGQNVVDMLNSGWNDYEDATQYRSANDEQADCIVTRNKKDFKASTIPVLTAAEFFKQIDSK